MAWLFILLAGACEMVWPLGFKYTHGFKEHYWAVGTTFAIMILSFFLMSRATNSGMPVGQAYCIWTGIGAAGTAVLGMMFFKEPHDVLRLLCLGLIIAGAAGLRFVSPPTDEGAATSPASVPAATQTPPSDTGAAA